MRLKDEIAQGEGGTLANWSGPQEEKTEKLFIYLASYYYNVYKNNDYLMNKIKEHLFEVPTF